MSIRPSKVAESTTPASVFASHYDFLVEWALHFAQRNHAVAEDLVQETFVRFVRTQGTAVKDPENAKGLLYTFLKNVHLGELRKTLRHPLQSMTTIEFDSLQIGLREKTAVHPIEAQDELRDIMAYLCWRKETLKPASILLLRFFYSYTPAEITAICLMSRQSIDHGLSTAREEVREQLKTSGSLSIVRADGPPVANYKHVALPIDQLLGELNDMLFSSRSTPCLQKEALLSFYTARPRKALSCAMLAHLVSCRHCLNRVHAFHDYPDTQDRGSNVLIEMMKRPPLNRGKGKTAVKADLKGLIQLSETRSREVFEHRPRTLLLIVNGETVASQDVCSSTNTQRVEWKPDNALDFIEVETDQGISLISMPVKATTPLSAPQLRQDEVCQLSDGRSASVCVTFSGLSYTIEVTYNDPLFFSTATLEARELYESELFGEPATTGHPSLSLPADLTPLDSTPGLWRRVLGHLHWIKMLEFNPIFATAVVFAIASVLCFLIWTKWSPVPITANELLVRAESWDSAAHLNASVGVVRQRVSISDREGTYPRTLYRDIQGIRRPKPDRQATRTEAIRMKLSAAGVNWNEPLSVGSYQDWHDHQHVRRDRIARSAGKLLTLTTTTPDGPVAAESITVREGDFHPVRRTIQFRDEDSVQIAELEYEVMPWSKADPDWFEPLTPTGSPSSRSTLPTTPLRLPAVVDDQQIDVAELQTRIALSRLSADVSGRLEIVRSGRGVEVKGVVATPDRKRELESELRLIPHVTSEISTFEELDSRAATDTQTPKIEVAAVVESVTPLQIFLLAKGWSRDQIGVVSQDLFIRSGAIERESLAIRDLETRFGQPTKLDGQGRSALKTLLSQHRNRLLSELRAEQELLSQVDVPHAIREAVAEPASSDGYNVGSAARANRTLCNELLTGTDQQPRRAELILNEIELSLLKIGKQTEQDSASSLAQDASSAPVSTSHGKQ